MTAVSSSPKEVGGWYLVRSISQDVYRVTEPSHVSFYVFKHGSEGLFIDSGLGLIREADDALLATLGIETFEVVNTHTHCDHIGLSARARSVRLSRAEWEKYEANRDIEQIRYYHEALRLRSKWPRSDANWTPATVAWRPTSFIADGDEFDFGRWHFRVIAAPGHTCGSLIFNERTTHSFFTGDLVYTGTHYLNLKDSDPADYRASLEKLNQLVPHPGSSIWPSHNQIPLDPTYIEKVSKFLEECMDGRASPRSVVEKNALFEKALLFKNDEVTLAIREDFLEKP